MSEARALSAFLASLTLSACVQEHLSIGERIDDAGVARSDASRAHADARADISSDARTPVVDSQVDVDEEDGGVLYAGLRALGFDDVGSLNGQCGVGCVDLELNGRGGTPPYDFVWFDGAHAPRRRFCDDGGVELQYPLATVTDARQSTTTVAGMAYIDRCDSPLNTEPSSTWSVCYGAASITPDCGSAQRLWFDAGRTLPFGAYVSVLLNVSGVVPATVTIGMANALCGDLYNVGVAPVWSGGPNPVSSSAVQDDAEDLRYVGVTSADGTLPPWLSVARVDVCLQL